MQPSFPLLFFAKDLEAQLCKSYTHTEPVTSSRGYFTQNLDFLF